MAAGLSPNVQVSTLLDGLEALGGLEGALAGLGRVSDPTSGGSYSRIGAIPYGCAIAPGHALVAAVTPTVVAKMNNRARDMRTSLPAVG